MLAQLSRSAARSVLTLHNLGEAPCRVKLALKERDENDLLDLLGDRRYPPPGDLIELDGYGYRWLRVERKS